MSDDQEAELRIYAFIGLCLLYVQQAERVLADALKSVLKDPTLSVAQLTEQTGHQRKSTLGDFLRELRRRANIERGFDRDLRRFLKMRNTLVHNVTEVRGWNLATDEGRKAATKFVVELLLLALRLTGVFVSLFTISAKEEFGKDLIDDKYPIEAKHLMDELEKHFGSTARKILAARNRKPLLFAKKKS